MPHECIVSAHHAANAGIDLLANAVVAAADVVAIAGDVDVDWTAAADGMMNVIDSYPEVAFHHQAVGTFPERTSSVPVGQCLVPYFPSRRARTKCKKTRKFDPSIRVAFCRTLFHWKFGSNRNGEKMPPFVPKENSGKNIFG